MSLLDRVEQFLERSLEGGTGKVFRQKIQPAAIGKKLERAMLDNQKASVGSNIVPNAYTVRLNPSDFAQIEGYAESLARQMESHLVSVASKRQLTVLAKLSVTFIEDERASQRHPRVDAVISDRSAPVGGSRRQRHQRPAPVDATTTFDVPGRSAGEMQLRTVSGPLTGTFTIPEGRSTIGRSPDNAIVIDLPDVSRLHARIERSGEHLLIRDENSTNGTRVNGEAVYISEVQEGDHIQVGSQILELISSPARPDGGRRW